MGRTVPTYVWRVDGSDLAFESFNDAALEVTRGGVGALVGRHAAEMYADSPDVLDLLRRWRDGHTIVRQRLQYRFRSVARTADLDITCTWVPPDRVSVSAVEYPSAPPRGTETVLLVEDEPKLRESAARALRHLGYTVVAVADPLQAWARLERGGIDVVLSDLMLPHKTGAELLRELRESGRDTPFLLMTGYGPDEIPGWDGRAGQATLLLKPWALPELAWAMRAALGRTA